MSVPAAAHGLSISAIEDRDIPEVIALWQRCGSTRPWNDPAADIALARKEANSTILLGRNDGVLVASVLVGHDGHRGWVYYVTADPEHRFKGYGRAIMSAAEGWLGALCSWTHERGGLFVADEVQSGFGRTGAAFWGYQRHSAEPDLVTLGKPMGN